MSSVIQNLLDNTIGDGARSTKFDCMVHFADSRLFKNEKDIFAMVKTSQFPGKSNDVIDFKFKGHSVPLKGQTKYDGTWTCTFYMTQDHALKIAFENWIESLDYHNIKSVSNVVKSAQMLNDTSGYTTIMYIAQLDFNGSQQTAIYELHGVFPKSVSAVDVDYSAVGTITEFTVEFAYAYYDTKIQAVGGGSFVDDLISSALSDISNLASLLKDNITDMISNKISQITSGIPGLNNMLNSMGSSNTKSLFNSSKMFTKKDWSKL